MYEPLREMRQTQIYDFYVYNGFMRTGTEQKANNIQIFVRVHYM